MSNSPYPKTATDPLGIYGPGPLIGHVSTSAPNRVMSVNGVVYVTNADGWWVPAEVENIEPAPAITVGPRKPPPALPVEVHNTQAFDAERAHAATLAACRGQR